MKKLGLTEKYARLNMHADRTYSEAIEKMVQHGSVLVVRPTGFGKTRLLIKLAKEYAKSTKKKVLYVYPLDIIKTEIFGKDEYTKDGILEESVEFISYQTLTLRNNDVGGEKYWYDILKDDYSIIMLDEVHRAGSDGFLSVYENIKELIRPDGIHMIGVTATPNRMMDTEDMNVSNLLFKGVDVYRFDLYDAFKEGILPEIILACRKYNLEDLAEQLRIRQKAGCKKAGVEFDEKVFNVELGKVLREIGGEPEYIYKYIKIAGYNLLMDGENYMKFIVFFVNIADMAERGPIIEQWFNDAINIVGKKDQGFRKDFKINSFYVASSDSNNEISNLIEKDREHRSFLKNTSKLNNIESESRSVDLLFTVNMINMGYHVEDISGIMMLRGTKSEIVYYQQLGRCLSVKAIRKPIVYDMVMNKDEKFWYLKDRKIELAKIIYSERDTTGEGIDFSAIDIFAEGDSDELDDFVERWRHLDYSENSKIIYMYTDRKTPICVIASALNKSCSAIAKVLVSNGVQLYEEDAMYNNIRAEIVQTKDKQKVKIIKYIYSSNAKEWYSKLKDTTQHFYDKVIQIITTGGK